MDLGDLGGTRRTTRVESGRVVTPDVEGLRKEGVGCAHGAWGELEQEARGLG